MISAWIFPKACRYDSKPGRNILKTGRSFSKSRQIILKGEWSASDQGHIIQKYEKCAPKLGDVSAPRA
jgi:hypothetical protein